MDTETDPGPTEDQATNWNEANAHQEPIEHDEATDSEPPRCTAHGRTVDDPAHLCALNPSDCNQPDGGGCGVYFSTGMHWDTCPNRVVDYVQHATNRDTDWDWVLASDRRKTSPPGWKPGKPGKTDVPMPVDLTGDVETETGGAPFLPPNLHPAWLDRTAGTIIDCTHGADCRVHPNAQTAHNYDPLIPPKTEHWSFDLLRYGPSSDRGGDTDDELQYPPLGPAARTLPKQRCLRPYQHPRHVYTDRDDRGTALGDYDCDGGMAVVLPTPIPSELHERLAGWWRDKAEAEIDATAAKAIEYGSTDLTDIGHQLARVAGRTITDTQAAEWGVAFYALGKISRIMAAITEGRDPSMDSWLDLGVYSRMAQRIKESGGWPFGPGDD